jgi:putative ABC transport system permease protein
MYLRFLTWNLRQRRWQHLLNAVAIAVTVAVVMMFSAVVAEILTFLHRSESNQLTRILPRPKIVASGATGTPMAWLKMFQEIDGVRVAQRYLLWGGKHPSGARYLIAGEEDSGIELNSDFFPVEPAVFEAWKKERTGAIVTDATARDLGLQVGQVAEVPSGNGPVRIKVVGFSHGATVGQRIAVHFDYARELLGNPDTCDFRVFTEPRDYERVARELIERTKSSAMPVQPINSTQFAAGWVRKAGTVPALLGFLGIFLVFTTGLTLANSAAITVRERRTETATLRVIGFHRGALARILVAESVVVGLIGGVLAIAVTYLLFRDGVQLTPGAAQVLKPVTIGLVPIVAGLVTAIAIPLAGSLPSAIATVRAALAEALRDTA